MELPKERAGPSAGRGAPRVSFGAPSDDQMSNTALEGEPSLSGDDNSAALPTSGVVALSEPDPEMMAMLSQATENVGLVWNPPPRPDPSRLDEWFPGGGRAGSRRPPLVPFFPEVHEALKRSWKAPFTVRNKSVAPPTSPPSMVEPLWGTRASTSARGPETGDPESEETAHWEMVTAPLPPPEEGRVENILFLFRHWPGSQRYPKLH